MMVMEVDGTGGIVWRRQYFSRTLYEMFCALEE